MTTALATFTITAAKPAKGSAFAKRFNVDFNGKPFAFIGKFIASQGGNFAVGFAFGTEGGRFDTYEAAEAYVRSEA